MSKYLPEYMIAQWGAEARRETRQRRREVAAASRLEAPAELGATLPSGKAYTSIDQLYNYNSDFRFDIYGSRTGS